MPHPDSLPHIYQRAVSGDSHDSLSIIASLIEPGQTLLDLGMGTGGLGHYLSKRHAIVADGVTLNQAEADIAAAWYRQVAVADLDAADLRTMFEGQQYDCIVCADVLEHLKAPENVLAQCKALLKPGGRLITSVPNAGYCGLIAELIMGDFRYRPEGLLDATHLRFFTRTSLQRFFDTTGWKCVSVQVTQRNLLASEFKLPFDLLPPTVAQHLLALPDAMTYQFVSVLQPAECATQIEPARANGVAPDHDLPEVAEALFSASLYLCQAYSYDESKKLTTSGVIGMARQNLIFDIAASSKDYKRIRLDPADRPGFFRLHSLQVRLADGQVVWQWVAGLSPLSTLSQSVHQQMVISLATASAEEALLLLYGDDPWIELPLPPEVLQQISHQGAQLVVCAGWPMSADYLQASTEVIRLQMMHTQDFARQAADYQDAYNKQAEEYRKSLASKALALEQSMATVSQIKLAQTELVAQMSATKQALQQVQTEKLSEIAAKHAAEQAQRDYLTKYNQVLSHLQTIERSTVFRVTRPLVKIKMQLDRLFGKPQSQPASLGIEAGAAQNPMPISLPSHPVDIIVPVYRGLEDTQCCIESVLNATCQTTWRLIVINDCSPEPDVTTWLRELAQREPRMTLLENTENLGFVATVNRGMALNDDNDVLLLNSDAEVANDWLDRIQRAAYSQPHVASVTPFSNNATICSYPRFCEPNPLPTDCTTGSLDRLFAQHLAGQTIAIPTGVGFCMYVRRKCLQEVGLFDVARFGKGYGEENDFCVRAQKAGWINLHALDTFVRHSGGISFGASKSERELQAYEILKVLHPSYEPDVQNFVKLDPARSARMRIDMARITGSHRPVVLSVTHNREGGTLRHIHEMAQQLGKLGTFLRLTPAPKGVVLRLEGVSEGFELHFALPQELDHLEQTLRLLQVAHVHYHHVLGHDASIFELSTLLGVSHDFTAHDYYSYCPQISLTDHTDRYCGEQGLAQCHQCLQRNPAPENMSIEAWRERYTTLLNHARYVMAPSEDTAQRMQRFVPAARVQVVPHAQLFPDAPEQGSPQARTVAGDQPLKVVVLGALSKIKGADVLEAVATLAANEKSPIEFHLIGYAYRSLRTQPKARLTVHGAYEEQDLPKLLAWLKPDVVWFPALWPETYSYTLSASLEARLPIIAPTIGAFAERLQNRDWTWLCDWQNSPKAWLAFFEHIRAHHFCTGTSPAPIEMPERSTTQVERNVGYFDNYLGQLPTSVAPDSAELALQQRQIDILQHRTEPPATPIKSSALRAIIYLRAMSALSPVAKLVPTHVQRRVKSWLRN